MVRANDLLDINSPDNMKTLYIGKNIDDIQWSIENTEISVIFCSNSLEAINILKVQKDVEAIICEYNLTGNNGLYLHNKLKEEVDLSAIPFILLLQEHNTQVYQAAFRAGVNDYFVIKSTNIEEIFLRAKQLSRGKEEAADAWWSAQNDLYYQVGQKLYFSKKIY